MGNKGAYITMPFSDVLFPRVLTLLITVSDQKAQKYTRPNNFKRRQFTRNLIDCNIFHLPQNNNLAASINYLKGEGESGKMEKLIRSDHDPGGVFKFIAS